MLHVACMLAQILIACVSIYMVDSIPRNVWQTCRIEGVLESWNGNPSTVGALVPTIPINSDLWTSENAEGLARLNGDSESYA